MKTIIAGLSLVVLLAITFFFFTTKSKESWKNIKDENMGFSVDYPSNWKHAQESAFFSLYGKKVKGEDFATYVRITNQNAFENDPEPNQKFNSLYSLDSNSPVDFISKNDRNGKKTVTKLTDLSVNGQRAVLTREYSQTPGPYFVDKVYIEKGDMIWTIWMVSQTKEGLDKNNPVFEKMLQSLKVL